MADFTLTFTLRTNLFFSGKLARSYPGDKNSLKCSLQRLIQHLQLRDYGRDTAIFGEFEGMEGTHEPTFFKKYLEDIEFAAIYAGKEGVPSGKHLVASYHFTSAIKDDLALKALNLLSLQRPR